MEPRFPPRPKRMPAATTQWDQVLRALVYQAYAAKGTPAVRQAAEEIVDTHARWPLVQYAVELRWARTVSRRRARWLADGVLLMRETYPAGDTDAQIAA
jgi:hypothetical protein